MHVQYVCIINLTVPLVMSGSLNVHNMNKIDRASIFTNDISLILDRKSHNWLHSGTCFRKIFIVADLVSLSQIKTNNTYLPLKVEIPAVKTNPGCTCLMPKCE